MVAVNESAVFEPEIRRVETTDAVQGGEPNPALGTAAVNILCLQLANRTRWLYNTVTTLTASLAALTAAELLARLKTVDGAASGLDADLLDGKEASAFWQTSDAVFSVGANGYQIFPSGLILQWGSNGGGKTVSFPISFPSEVYSISLTDRSSELFFSIESYDLDGFVMGPSGQGNYTSFFMALGR